MDETSAKVRALTGIHLQVLQHHQHHPPGCSDTLHFPASEHETPGRSSFETIMLRSGFELKLEPSKFKELDKTHGSQQRLYT